MKISELIKKLEDRQRKYGDIEVAQLMGIYDSEKRRFAEKLVPIKRLKLGKNHNFVFVDFV